MTQFYNPELAAIQNNPGYSQAALQQSGQVSYGPVQSMPGPTDPNMPGGRTGYAPLQQTPQGYTVPPTGLAGRENALNFGLQGGLQLLLGGLGNYGGGYGTAVGAGPGANVDPNYSGILNNRDLAMQQMRAGIQNLDPWAQQGYQASQQQAALSGALGGDAQRQAYAAFNESPGQQWLREQGERAVTRNAAATGGLQGGNVLKELTRYGQGMAQQDFQNHFNRLSGLADRGMQAVGQQTGLRGQGMGAATAAGGQMAGLQGQSIGARASMANAQEAAAASRYGSRLGLDAARIASDTALRRDAGNLMNQMSTLAALGRTDAGNAIGNNFNLTAQGLAGLSNQQGAGLADIFGQGTAGISNILLGGGRDQSQSITNLAQLLSGARTGSAQQVGQLHGLPGTAYNPGTLGQWGNLLSGIGGFMGGF